MAPGGGQLWNAARFHHVDAHYLPDKVCPNADVLVRLSLRFSLVPVLVSLRLVDALLSCSHAQPPQKKWIAVTDGDDKPDDYQFFLRQGWFRHLKDTLAVLLSLALAALFLNRRLV
jgi:hypothetical protein